MDACTVHTYNYTVDNSRGRDWPDASHAQPCTATFQLRQKFSQERAGHGPDLAKQVNPDNQVPALALSCIVPTALVP